MFPILISIPVFQVFTLKRVVKNEDEATVQLIFCTLSVNTAPCCLSWPIQAECADAEQQKES